MTTQTTDLIKGIPDWHDTINSNFQIVANAIDSNLDKIGDLTTDLVDIKNLNAYNILNYGGSNDGTTPNDSTLTNVLALGNVYFPQNSSGDAKYYFTNDVNFNSKNIYADNGVILSFPNNWYSVNGTPFNGVFKTNIEIESRDRLGTTVTMFKNDFARYYSLIGGDLDVSYGENKISNITTTDINVYTWNNNTNTLANSKATIIDNDMYQLNSGRTGENQSNHYYVSIAPKLGYKYDALYKFPSQDGIDYIGVVMFNSSTGEIHKYALYPSAFVEGEYVKGGTYSENNVNIFMKNKLNDSKWYWEDSLTVSFRMISSRKFEFYLNDVLIDTLVTNFDMNMGGFLLSGNSANTTEVGRITSSVVTRSLVTNSLNIAVFGDSLSQGDSGGSWVNYLKDILVGKYGINKFTYDNFAVGGQKSSQQLAIMQTKDLSSYDVVCILIGSNDVLTASSDSDFYTNITAMVQLAVTAGKRVVVGMIPFSMNYSDTNIGHNFGNCQIAPRFRQQLRKAIGNFNSNKIVIADILSEVGRVSLDNFTEIIHDNVHHKMFGELIISRAFARGIIKSYSSIVEDVANTIPTDATLTSINASGTVSYHKVNRVVSIQGWLSFTTAFTTNSTAIASIPSNLDLPKWATTNFTVITMVVDSSGTYGYAPLYIDVANKQLCIHGGVRGNLSDIKQANISLTFVI